VSKAYNPIFWKIELFDRVGLLGVDGRKFAHVLKNSLPMTLGVSITTNATAATRARMNFGAKFLSWLFVE
jgi:hypothetical protein